MDRRGARRARRPALPDEASADDTASVDDGGGLGGSGLLGWTNATSKPQVEVALAHDIALLATRSVRRRKTSSTPRTSTVSPSPRSSAGPTRRAKQVEQGVDIVIAQGTEAGGHTGEIATMVLVPEVVEAIAPTPSRRRRHRIGASRWRPRWRSARRRVDRVDLARRRREQHGARGDGPVVRSHRARRVARVPSPASPRHAADRVDDGVGHDDCPGTLPMPLQFMATQTARARIARSARRDLFGMPVGQIVGSMNKVQTTRQVVLDMVQEYIETVEKMAGGLAGD